MADETQEKILALVDVISVEVLSMRKEDEVFRTEVRGEFSGLRNEMRASVDRLGQLETRVEHLESEVGEVKTNVIELKIDVRGFRDEFERRIAPLER